MKVYMAGPMENLDTEGVFGWRNKLASEKKFWGLYTFLSPGRGKEAYFAGKHHADNSIVTEAAFVTMRDLEDVKSCDMMVIRWDETQPMRGTCVELGYATAIGKPIMYFGDKPTHPIMANLLSRWPYYETIEELIHALRLYAV